MQAVRATYSDNSDSFTRKVFTQPMSPQFARWVSIINFWIFVSCLSLAGETVEPYATDYGTWFDYIEYTAVLFFTLDYLSAGTTSFNIGADKTLENIFSGAGGLKQSSLFNLTLTANNSYTGATTINVGSKLSLSGTGSIATSSGVADSGILDISSTTSGASIKTITGSGNVTLGAQNLTLTTTAGTYSGVISARLCKFQSLKSPSESGKRSDLMTGSEQGSL